MEQKNYEQFERAIVLILAIAVAVLALGTVALPAVLARVYGWRWLLAYPVGLALLIAWAAHHKGG